MNHFTFEPLYHQYKGRIYRYLFLRVRREEDAADLENLILQQERLTRLHQLLDQLAPYKRELLALRFSAGLSTTEIALVVGKSQAAVQKQLTRTLQSLKEQMA